METEEVRADGVPMKTLYIRMERDLHDRLMAAADALQVSTAAYVRLVLMGKAAPVKAAK